MEKLAKNDFIQKLNQVAAAHGIQVLDQILGGLKLDYYLIYNAVTSLGGYFLLIYSYEKTTADKQWKTVSNLFNFPATCTNSSAVIKQVYFRYLLALENHLVWGKPLPAPVVTAPQMMARLNQQRPMIPMNPPPIPQKQIPEMKYLSGPNPRILLSLESRLDNEVDWALVMLVKISFTIQNNWTFNSVPGLLDSLIDLCKSFFDGLKLSKEGTTGGSAGDDCEIAERVMLCLRNFGFNIASAQVF